jgi:hypothetical protein
MDTLVLTNFQQKDQNARDVAVAIGNDKKLPRRSIYF